MTVRPLVMWRKQENYVNFRISEKKYSFKRPSVFFVDSVVSFDPEFGMVYIKSTNSTYQFVDYQNSLSWLGDLINDVTSLVFLRYDRKHWRLYSKGKIVKFDETKKESDWADSSKIDFRTNYYVGDKALVVILRDFAKAPIKKLMPAFYR